MLRESFILFLALALLAPASWAGGNQGGGGAAPNANPLESGSAPPPGGGSGSMGPAGGGGGGGDGIGNDHSGGRQCKDANNRWVACPPSTPQPTPNNNTPPPGPNGITGNPAPNGEATMTRAEAEALLRGHNIKDSKPVKEPTGTPPPAPPAPPPADAPVDGVKLGLGATASLYKGGPSGTGLSLAAMSNSAVDFLASASNSSRRGDQRGVIRDASEDLKLEPNNADALRMRGQALAKSRQFDLAEKDLKRAVAVNDKDAKAWQYLAYNFLKQKNFAEALKAIDYALELDPNDPHAHMLRALILDALGRREEALAELEIAARLDARYREKLDSAMRGEKIYDPEEDLSDELLRKKRRAAEGGLPPWAPWAAGAAMLGGFFIFVLVILARRAVPAVAPVAAPAAASGATVVGGAGDSMRLSRLGGKYEVLRPLGAGGMGEVHEAMDHTLGRVVAMKSMASSLSGLGSKGREMFVREAKTVAALRHPAIVDIYEMVEENETLYLVFELVRGKTVAKILSLQNRLSLDETLKVLGPVCEALDFAHAQGLIHRDLKPANIMVTDQGHVKLMDFGIARSVSETRRKTPVGVAAGGGAASVTVIGTPAYMAPEALSGQLRKESDVFSLGAMVYEMLTGAPPRFGAAPASTLVAGLPPAVDAVLSAALEPDPERSIKTPGELLSRLRAAAGR